jgi:5-methyltetrahydropteroyltriglutamate--homocysteine methyltransferase
MRASKTARFLGLPLFPSTTIGSLPQTARYDRNAQLSQEGFAARDYDAFNHRGNQILRQAFRKDIGLVVLVHGELSGPNVELFGEKLSGFAFTEHGLGAVLRFARREANYVYGDVFAAEAMTSISRPMRKPDQKAMKGS